MRGLLKTLAKVGLVELDEHERQTVPTSEPAKIADMQGGPTDAGLDPFLGKDPNLGQGSTVAPRNVSEPRPVVPAWAQSGLEVGRPLETIYELANIAPSPYPAEKLLKVLDGLKAMDPATRKVAVLAMDAADDTWTIDDSVLDAQRKIKALNDARIALDKTLGEAETKAQADRAAQDTYQTRATEAIREQIAELERTLERELASVAEEKAAIEMRLHSTRSACADESQRFTREIARLDELVIIFAPPQPPPPSARPTHSSST